MTGDPSTTPQPLLVTQSLLDQLCAEAAAHPRRRKNLNFHDSDGAACHRLLNALETGTYIQPHRHLGEGKDETVAVIRGRLGLVFFDETGRVIAKHILAPNSDAVGVHVPRGLWHTWVVLEPHTVFLESKAGPYRPFTPEERAPWAPPEGHSDAAGYLRKLQQAFESRSGATS
jgi:cupin fold WbuC family metalloprotein